MKIRSVLQSRVAPCGQMEEQDEANSRFSQFFLSNFTKIRSVGAELLHADRGRTRRSQQPFFAIFFIKFHENPFSGSRVAPCGQMDEQDEANSRFSQFL